jgi:hypothetical protein
VRDAETPHECLRFYVAALVVFAAAVALVLAVYAV